MSRIPKQTEILSVGWVEGQAPAFARSIMDTMLSYADVAVNGALGLSLDVDNSDLNDIVIPTVDLGNIDFSRALDALEDLLARFPADPVFSDIDTTVPTAPTLSDPPSLSTTNIPDFTGVAPSLDVEGLPTLDDFTAPTEPTITYPDNPDRPSITYPDVPTLSDVEIPTPLSVDIPLFTSTLTDEELTSPSNTFAFDEQEYSSTLKTAIQSGLYDDVANGDYGLETTDETNLWYRAREREQLAANQAVTEAVRSFVGSGFTMPVGAMMNAVERGQQAVLNKTSSINREQTLERSNKYWDGKQFAYSKGIELEGILINFHSAVQERSLNAAKASIQVAIDIFNADVVRYKADQERYAVQAQVFKTRVEAEMLKVEIYKGQLDGARLKNEVNQSHIDLYKARLEGIKAVIEVYKADVETTNILAQIEKLRMEVFRAQTDAYVAQVEANKIEFEAYESKIKGQVARTSAYESEARAFAATIDGKKAQIDANKLILEEYVQRNRAIIEKYKTSVDYYKDLRDAQKSVRDGQVAVYDAKTKRFGAEADALGKVYDMQSKQAELEYRAQLQALQASSENAKIQLEKVVQLVRLQVEAFRAKNQTYTALAASALSAMNVNTSISASTSETLGKSISRTSATSNTSNWRDSYDDNHQWEYSNHKPENDEWYQEP